MEVCFSRFAFRGAKSEIVANPENMTKEQRKMLIQTFARALKPVSPRWYVAGPDANTAEEEMRWYAKANGSLRSCTGKPEFMCVKPRERCGIPHEYGSTGFGCFPVNVGGYSTGWVGHK